MKMKQTMKLVCSLEVDTPPPYDFMSRAGSSYLAVSADMGRGGAM